MKRLKLLSSFIIMSVLATAQRYENVKFGDITEADFLTATYPIDTTANAIILLDIGSASIIGNDKSSLFSLSVKHFRRVHIINKNGFDIANVSLALYKEGQKEEKIEKLKAVTYNLENGKVIQTKLENKSVFTEKTDAKWSAKKFTLPNVKEGSIIEYEYNLVSDFITLPEPWLFQGAYPRLWSEYSFAVPSFFSYVYLRQGYLDYTVIETKNAVATFNIKVDGPEGAYGRVDPSTTQSISFQAGVTTFSWAVKNAPALIEEKFTSSINNHFQRIAFQLDETREPLSPHKYIESWTDFTKKLITSDDFGQQIGNDPNWLGEISKPVTAGVIDKKEKAKRLFRYIRDNFTCTSNGAFMNKSLKEVVNSRTGTVAEINILLLALLRHENIDADPVLVSTRDHGKMYQSYPILAQFNYLIDRVVIDDQEYFLDATEWGLGFGLLPLHCFNEEARMINALADPVRLSPNTLVEKKNTNVILANDKSGWAGVLQQTPGYYGSLDWRKKIKRDGKENWQKELQKQAGTGMTLTDFRLDSLDQYESSLALSYHFSLSRDEEDIIYINPMFGEVYKENPFKAANRLYPVEMPYTSDETYTFSMEVPDNYVVDELPKDVLVKFNNREEGLFEYKISRSGSTISFRSRILLKKANFSPVEYQSLREFFGQVVKKQAEQIVLKKKK